ncbi:hypothetical protein LTR97_000776 [Elasticomyces elasticus]|uniref:Uncharacterized protein n=1 Tax=Elasticomyces elasticus TaxID=574655 RepID=A0AAN7WDR7_9PEZI|nr:hypothetical protein LTR97_000776 [Elasticomyces elasticus]
MELSRRYEGSHATASPSGCFIAYIINSKLRVSLIYNLEDRPDFPIKIAPKDITALKCCSDGMHIVLLSNNLIEVCSTDRNSPGIRIDNGGRALGSMLAVDFVRPHHLLTCWEFGTAKVWDLKTAKAIDLPDLKTAGNGSPWQERPKPNPTVHTLALLARPAAEDTLTLYFPELCKSTEPIKLPTVDAQSISWSPDGCWLAILDTPTASPCVHFYTPDGLLYNSYPAETAQEVNDGLGIKAISWSARHVALSRFDGRVVLLNNITFRPVATIEHTLTIAQSTLPEHQRALIWRESISASHERSYSLASRPVSLPLSRTKHSIEPAELGVAEVEISADGRYLATRDERMLSTVWFWNIYTTSAHSVVIQHQNVRQIQWHPTLVSLVMLDCGEGIAYLYDLASHDPPRPINVPLPGSAKLSWVHTDFDTVPAVLAATKSGFRVLYPEGRDCLVNADQMESRLSAEIYDEGTSEDSLADILSGRKPVTTGQSHTERLAQEVNEAGGYDGSTLDDTFRERGRTAEEEVDPLDDSQIF